MRSKFRSHLSYANVMATVAVFVALGGSSYAAIKVGSKQIVNNSIRSKDIRNDQVRSSDVRNGSLLSKDFKAGQLPTGPAGRQGPPGVPGADGTDGTDGANGATNTTIRTETAPVAANSTGGTISFCANGESVVGGAAYLAGATASEQDLRSTSVFENTDRFAAQIFNNTGSEKTVHVQAICTSP
jgi:hypothetical protein